jgi:hypothetical protein
MALLAGAVLLASACGSTRPQVGTQDGATVSASGGALGAGGTVAGTLGSGGHAGSGGGPTGSGAAASGGAGSGGTTGGIIGTGGRGSGGVGSGGIGGGGHPASGGRPGSGGTTRDAAAIDLAQDQAGGLDTAAGDAEIFCGPGYPVGSSRPQGDGCNTCYCQSGGSWLCTTKQCPAPVDGGPDAPMPPDDAALDVAPPDGGPGSCAEAKTQEACVARADCHPVFFDPGGCACLALGCCTQFEYCGDGATAVCTGTALCKMAEPHCEGPYVIAYTDSCYEGCALGTDCAP